MSKKQSVEFGSAIIGVAVAVVLVAVIYALTAARFQGSPNANAGSPAAIAERIKPVGKVVVAGSAPAPAAAPAAAVAVGPGEAIYNRVCTACHSTGAANAPKLGDKVAWEPRVSLGVDGLLKSSITGKNAMPPRGTCADCSDADLRSVIEYMLSKLQ